MATNLSIYVNTTAVDDTRIAQPGNFVLVDTAADKLIFSKGGPGVADGDDTPTSPELDGAASIIAATDVQVDKALLLDFSDTGNELKEIDLFGNGDDQFVFNLSFDNPTAAEPTLEAYDTNAHATADINVLGGGTPANSMLRAVLTTGGSPGASWTGTPISGGSLPNVLELNGGGGAFGAAAEVYINLQIVIPASFGTPFSETPVITTRFTFV